MPKQHTVTSYQFDELSDKAKGVARDWFRDGNLDYEWWENTYADAAAIGLKITGFDLGRAQRLEGKFTRFAVDVARAIVKDHGEGCETRKLAEAYLAGGEKTTAWLCHDCGTDNAPEHTTCRDCSEPRAGDEDLDWEGADETNEQFLRDLRAAYWSILNAESEYLVSDECVDESIRANEYDFTVDGRRFRY